MIKSVKLLKNNERQFGIRLASVHQLHSRVVCVLSYANPSASADARRKKTPTVGPGKYLLRLVSVPCFADICGG
jgi:hypothetical protein